VNRRRLVALAILAALVGGRHVGAEEGGDRATMARLEQRAKTFYELLERGDRERATAAFPDLAGDLTSFSQSLQTRLDRMRDEVMERDGDLEELYRSPRWRDPEVMSLVATYHLAWVRYQGAQLTGDAQKKRALLQKAVEGFSQFLLVNEVPEIYSESLYGRGLAFMDLGETGKAIEDLTAAAEEPRIGPKARVALEEARRRAAGGKQAPSGNEPEALIVRLGELLPRAGGGDNAAEKDATTLARGLAARGGPWPARVSSLVAEKLGSGTPASVHSSYGLFLLAQLAVDRNRCDETGPLADASTSVRDAGRARYRPEILYLDAGCRLNAGKARDAAERFASLLREFPEASRAREAAYYRFRALDVARASDAELTPAYEEALTSFLSAYPRADGAAEAHYLLAELRRSRNDCEHAAPEYAAVGAGPFAARARLGALECRVAVLTTKTAAPSSRSELVGGLRDLAHDVQDKDKGAAARAALLAALVAAGETPPDNAAIIDLTNGFEKRYPDAKEMHLRALELRLTARVGAGQLDEAGRDLDAYLAATPDDPERRKTLARLGRDLATRAERAGPTDGAPALALARRVYAAVVKEGGESRDRMMLADLDLRAGDAPAARRLYEEILAGDGDSVEAKRGAARAAAALGDRARALGYWRSILDASPPGGTAWYEARVAQVRLLADDGRDAEACELVRASRGRATSTGGDQLEAQLRALEPHVCH